MIIHDRLNGVFQDFDIIEFDDLSSKAGKISKLAEVQASSFLASEKNVSYTVSF